MYTCTYVHMYRVSTSWQTRTRRLAPLPAVFARTSVTNFHEHQLCSRARLPTGIHVCENTYECHHVWHINVETFVHVTVVTCVVHGGSFVEETYDFKEPTNLSHPIWMIVMACVIHCIYEYDDVWWRVSPVCVLALISVLRTPTLASNTCHSWFTWMRSHVWSIWYTWMWWHVSCIHITFMYTMNHVWSIWYTWMWSHVSCECGITFMYTMNHRMTCVIHSTANCR